jgi:flagellar M-ring protein FliF
MADPKTNPALAVLSQLKELWGKQSKARRMLVIAVVLGIAGVIAFGKLTAHTEKWMIVGDGSSPDDAQELMTLLSARNIPVRLKDGKLEVDGNRLSEARAIASAAGLPRTGKGFELFDTSSLGQSSFAEQVNYRRALQGELARSITALAQVQSARVHLALGKRSVFKDQDETASASVALHLHVGQTLTAEQVRGVRQMVAASIEGLKGDSVVVVDHHGNLLDGAVSGGDRKFELEQTLTARVRTMLERVVGPGKVGVVTTAVVDDRKLSETQEIYDQTNPVLRNEARTIDGDAAAAGVGGLAGTRGNLPGAPAAAPTPGGTGTSRLQETKNYEVNRTVRQMVKPDVQLQRLHLAIVVDHKAGADGKPVARTKDELAELTALARQAAGIDDTRGDKIEVRSIAFVADAETPAAIGAGAGAAEQLPLIPIAIGGGVLLMLVVFLVLKKKKTATSSAELERPMTLAFPTPISELERVLEARAAEPNALPGTGSEQPALPPGRPVRDRVLEVVRGDADRAAEVLTAWLSENVQAKGAK